MISKEEIERIPALPGVYLFKDPGGKILYIGKAASLKKRVASYFQAARPRETRLQNLIAKTSSVDYITCDSEAQALLLEASLVKEHQPFYNIELKDDKSYPYLQITREEYPRVCIARPRERTDAILIGPFPNVKLLREALKLVRTVIPFRSCKRLRPSTPCFFSHIKQCPGPCQGAVNRKEYRRAIHNLILLFRGEKNKLMEDFRSQMRRYAKEQKFEEAKVLRDRLFALQNLLSGGMNVFHQLKALEEALGIKKHLYRIEGFDLSSLSGKEAVGSRVCFIEGVPAKNFYRRFRIRDLAIRDDVGMMREVLQRRVRRLKEEGMKKRDMPGLIIVDGGLAHASMAKKLLEREGLYDMYVIGIAKKNEELWAPGTRKPVVLPKSSPALLLIQRIRDEAHRFARNYHLLLRGKRFL